MRRAIRVLTAISLVAVVSTLAPAASAGVPPSLCVQGYLESNTNAPQPVSGLVDFCVVIYDAPTGGTRVWPPGLPTDPGFCIPNVDVRSGLFAVVIGDASTSLTPDVFGNPDSNTNAPGPQPRWIEFATRTGAAAFETMQPRVELRTAPYAHRVGFVGNAELTDALEADSLKLGDTTPLTRGLLTAYNGKLPSVQTVRVDGHPLTLQTNGNQGRGGGVAVLSDDALAGAELYINTNGVPVMHMYNSVVGFAQETISLSANTFGGGRIRLQDNSTNQAVIISAGEHKLQMFNGQSPNKETITLLGNDSSGSSSFRMYNQSIAGEAITLNADGGSDDAPEFGMTNLNGSQGIYMRTAGLTAGPRLSISNGQSPNQETVSLDGNDSIAQPGDGGAFLRMFTGSTPNHETVTLDARDVDGSGRLSLSNGQSSNQETIILDARIPSGAVKVQLYNGLSPNAENITLEANDGGAGGGSIHLRDITGYASISLRGHNGSAQFTGCVTAGGFHGPGCDVAERFDHSDPAAVRPGMVMVIDAEQPGRLKLSGKAYDTRVAGIVSGAGGLKPGVVLGGASEMPGGMNAAARSAVSEPPDSSGPVHPRATSDTIHGTPGGVNAAARSAQHADRSNLPLALSGRVYCYVDTTHEAVEVGDLLTTSNTPGHAMKASDRERAFGAVLGKAMEPLAKGKKGLVLVLVALQ